ncbi:SMI1/KNR4 family protein [Priestia megaterium]|uniref:SMI1/KNR4 family protein n=1 Tax=Priestia megaterium TaxID=1404 RepID=A0A3D8WTR7_PRIMG|nr:SMI1/KNR4 family protein [Priestia megaterium]MDH3169021.1 SMI1/KNR4 family protein [Priestia megaterium]MED3854979.1 SMI1/KNR4 family protein [Priestia megaterium]RDZ06457.1 SMI1/KNR4 family protein [Priestia megaterium]
MWKDLIQNTSAQCVFGEPASLEDIAVLEKLFNIQLPDELKTLLGETNGTNDSNGCPLIWSTEQIIRENLNLGERIEDTYILFNNLLLVADAENGDMFGYSTLEGFIKQNNIYVWNHKNNRRKQVATSLKEFVEDWISGKLSI